MSKLPNFTIRQGETLPLTIEDKGGDAVSATLTAVEQENPSNVITVTGAFAGGEADLTVDDSLTTDVGIYDYQIAVTYANGDISKFPDENCDDGECGFATITICDALDVAGSV